MSHCKLNILCPVVRWDPSDKKESWSELWRYHLSWNIPVLVTRATSHDWSPVFLQFAAVQHSAAGDRTVLSGTRDTETVGGQGLWRAAVHFPSWTQTSVSSRLLAQENSNSWIQFRPLKSAATQKCNNVFFLVNIGLVFSIDDSEADFTVSWLRRSQPSLH